MTIPTTCPQRTVHPIPAVCREYLRIEQYPCFSCDESARLRQEQQRRRADAVATGVR